MRYNLTLIRMAPLEKKTEITGVGENIEKLEPLYIAHRNIKWYNCCENSMIILQKLKNRITVLELPERIENSLKEIFIHLCV